MVSELALTLVVLGIWWHQGRPESRRSGLSWSVRGIGEGEMEPIDLTTLRDRGVETSVSAFGCRRLAQMGDR
ncbi:hypothetical protein [Halalkalicoccus tibetensis]|uniref:Uncharacterized protein n=1 Tax=Halalkalicoccus tibetensis TaxID=175632 RepID=A0ABD5V2U4_9EURY